MKLRELSDRIEKSDAAFDVSGNHRITNAGKGDTQPLSLLL